MNDPLKNGTCEAESGGSCFKAVEEVYDPDTNNYVPEYTYGCLREEGKFFFATKNIFFEIYLVSMITYLFWYVCLGGVSLLTVSLTGDCTTITMFWPLNDH